MQVGLAFLPSNLIMAAFSIWLSARVVMRFGLRLPIVGGMLLAAAGLALFALAPAHGSFLPHVLPGMLLLGVGCGMALNPVMLASMSDVAPGESGLASGVVNTAFMMGGALGLAVLASVAAARSETLLAAGAASPAALTGGYQVAFVIGAIFAALAALLGALLLRESNERRAAWATP
jgi:MFS family permease